MKKTKPPKIKPGTIRRIPADPQLSPGIISEKTRTLIDAKKLVVVINGKHILLADILRFLTSPVRTRPERKPQRITPR